MGDQRPIDLSRAAVDWLLESDEPGVRLMARRDLLGEADAEEPVLDGPKVRALLAGQRADGGFGVHPYTKWAGAHWRLVSLVELGVSIGDPNAVAAAHTVLDWLTGEAHRSRIVTVDGLVRRCASQEGNALAVSSRLGLASDPRVELLAQSLIEWQWPDGGWNCGRGSISSYHESLAPAWGLHEYWAATGETAARESSLRAGELFLTRRLFRSLRTGEVINPTWVAFHYPPYWHYDILQALVVLARLGLVGDERASEALDIVERRRLPDGCWRPGAYWWRRPGSDGGNVEVIDWGRSSPNEMITLNALRVLSATGRVKPT